MRGGSGLFLIDLSKISAFYVRNTAGANTTATNTAAGAAAAALLAYRYA